MSVKVGNRTLPIGNIGSIHSLQAATNNAHVRYSKKESYPRHRTQKWKVKKGEMEIIRVISRKF